jgi:hydroxyacylglutathione hydrolase
MQVRRFVLDGLGHLSTLIADEATGVAAVVDPRRDVDVYLDVARELDLRIGHVVETHLHNDYVSGGRELVAATGAEHVIGAGAELDHPFRAVRGGDTFAVGGLALSVLDTPGHTPEHVAYAVADTARAGEPVLMFSGGSLLVGSVGRTDLLGQDQALPGAEAMFRSLHDTVLRHEDFVEVYPTHGAGSLCSAGVSSTEHTTIGFERRHNPLLQPTEVDTFARALLAGQPAFPRYFARMRPINQAGPRVLGGVPGPRPMTAGATRDALAGGALLVDLRGAAEHATSHVPGSLSIPAGSSFGTWLGWVVPDSDRPLVLLLEGAGDWDDAIRQAIRIGFESVVGYVDGGLAALASAGLPVEAGPRQTVDELARALAAGGPDAPLVIDVRQASEYESGHLPGSLAIGAGELPERLAALPRDHPVVTICEAGYRATIAASLLRGAGFGRVSPIVGGVPTWAAAGYPLEYGVAGVHIDVAIAPRAIPVTTSTHAH